eukprot:1911852-Pyramimonas_sp.AAC.1
MVAPRWPPRSPSETSINVTPPWGPRVYLIHSTHLGIASGLAGGDVRNCRGIVAVATRDN